MEEEEVCMEAEEEEEEAVVVVVVVEFGLDYVVQTQGCAVVLIHQRVSRIAQERPYSYNTCRRGIFETRGPIALREPERVVLEVADLRKLATIYDKGRPVTIMCTADEALVVETYDSYITYALDRGPYFT